MWVGGLSSWLVLESSGGLTELDIQGGSLPERALIWLSPGSSGGPASEYLHLFSLCGLEFLQHGSILRLTGSCTTPYHLALEVREHHFCHVLLSKSQAQDPGCEYWEVWVTGGRGSLLWSYVPQDKLSVTGARDAYPIGRTNKINDNKHKAITIAIE